MTVQIVEVLRRSEQGVTLPFICRGEDENTYFVKGRGAGRQSLITEYICGRLAQKFGLPIADFAIVDVPAKLIKAAILPDIAELGAGLAFGSKALPHVQELRYGQLKLINEQVAKDILVFDWWIRNRDRTLGPKGGNPNLLWDHVKGQIVVIDHNVAFETPFNRAIFAENHVFSALIPSVFEDLAEQATYGQRLQEAVAEFDPACHDIPPEWWWVDDGVPALFDRDGVKLFLSDIQAQDFWRIAK